MMGECHAMVGVWAASTFTLMHLADAFIQSDLQCIQAYRYCEKYVTNVEF